MHKHSKKEIIISIYIIGCLLGVSIIGLYYTDTIIEKYIFIIVLIVSLVLSIPNKKLKTIYEDILFLADYYDSIILKGYFVFIFFGSLIGIFIAIQEDTLSAAIVYLILLIISGIIDIAFIINWYNKNKKK